MKKLNAIEVLQAVLSANDEELEQIRDGIRDGSIFERIEDEDVAREELIPEAISQDLGIDIESAEKLYGGVKSLRKEKERAKPVMNNALNVIFDQAKLLETLVNDNNKLMDNNAASCDVRMFYPGKNAYIVLRVQSGAKIGALDVLRDCIKPIEQVCDIAFAIDVNDDMTAEIDIIAKNVVEWEL